MIEVLLLNNDSHHNTSKMIEVLLLNNDRRLLGSDFHGGKP